MSFKVLSNPNSTILWLMSWSFTGCVHSVAFTKMLAFLCIRKASFWLLNESSWCSYSVFLVCVFFLFVCSASDAYCLLEIYEKLCKDPASFGLNSDLTKSLVGKPTIKARAKKQLNKQEVPSPCGQVCKHLQRAACCSRPLQIIRCLVSQSYY